MFEPEAYVADWERTGLVPAPAWLLTPPDLADLIAAGPPLVDEFADEECPPDGACVPYGGDARDGMVPAPAADVVVR